MKELIILINRDDHPDDLDDLSAASVAEKVEWLKYSNMILGNYNLLVIFKIS